MKIAAGPWTSIKRAPEPGRSYLICATYGGVQTCDVVDVVDSSTRLRMMAGIGGRNTKPEILLRQWLHGAGLRFRLHVA